MSRHQVFDDEPYVVIEKHSGSVSSFVLGIAIGAGLALLFAPQSGADTRRGIRRRAVRARDEVNDRVVGTFNDARRRVEDRIDSARTAIELKRQQVQRAVDAGRAAAQQARDDLERRIAERKAAYRAEAAMQGSAAGAGEQEPGED